MAPLFACRLHILLRIVVFHSRLAPRPFLPLSSHRFLHTTFPYACSLTACRLFSVTSVSRAFFPMFSGRLFAAFSLGLWLHDFTFFLHWLKHGPSVIPASGGIGSHPPTPFCVSFFVLSFRALTTLWCSWAMDPVSPHFAPLLRCARRLHGARCAYGRYIILLVSFTDAHLTRTSRRECTPGAGAVFAARHVWMHCISVCRPRMLRSSLQLAARAQLDWGIPSEAGAAAN